VSRECSAVAAGLIDFAGAVRREHCCLALPDELQRRVHELPIPEVISFEFAQQLAHSDPGLLADSAQRLALRLKRRVAFERKMLARTASGRRRGAIAATAPGIALLGLRLAGLAPPFPALVLLVAVEAFGGGVVWRVSRVEV
ncbi:MAG TPA: hypothetical protein VFZ61_29145, partial [Polyangiales bacterium]